MCYAATTNIAKVCEIISSAYELVRWIIRTPCNVFVKRSHHNQINNYLYIYALANYHNHNNMKKGLVFFLGVLTGLLIFFLISLFVARKNGQFGEQHIPGLTIYEEPGAQLQFKSFKVLQVINGGALVYASNSAKISDYLYYSCPVAFLLPPATGGYYDDQILVPPAGMICRQAGTYQYVTNVGGGKTVPVVKFYPK